ncbi:RNA-directed DNA polymerase [Staphylococcus pettenkoferi]|uniref:RNA-directed DNA polymerase n=1 Tax=Staphylococcus pettenkoferi TaxID=170573 RepID=UPI0022730003|nr:RNA-directed DNA polymerase [Staphylococcus pettenkoferi]MCY1573119.1 RNA-directed DNA polymerase [Staphylococcus pettenkoferi]MCY1579281.1 RNA-directed DNA polymerase [Staphylococcus pettenkoferi]
MTLRTDYEKLFDTRYLINYGYFDLEPENLKEISYISNYGKSDSFYYKIFNLNELTNYIENNKKHIKQILSEDRYSSAISFTIPKNDLSRREYKMPNFYNYLKLMYFMQSHMYEFINVFLENQHSLSKFFTLPNYEYNFTDRMRKRLIYGGKNHLKLDLSNFYHSLYTHSIPWVIMGKKKAKKNRNNGFANKLDKYLRYCQDNQTHGIPTGNLLTRIISELYMCYIDKNMKEKGYIYARYVDDIIFSYNLESEKENFYKQYDLICRSNELKINDKKTEINTYPFRNVNNKHMIFNYFDKLTENSKDYTWIDTISNFIEFCVSEESNGNKGAIKCIFPVIRNAFKFKKISNEKIKKIITFKEPISEYNIIAHLLDLSLKDSRLTNRFLQLINYFKNKSKESKTIRDIIEKYFKNNSETIIKLLFNYNRNIYNQETYQILIYIIEFDINILSKENCLSLINENSDDFSLCLLTVIYLKYKWNIIELLQKIDELFLDATIFINGKGKMSQDYWFF